jgi:hypothetical protein
VISAPVEVTVLTNDREASETIGSQLRSTDPDLMIAEKRGLDGGVADWIIAAVAASGGIKPFLDFLLEYRKLDRVTSITLGELTIENPRPEDIEDLKRRADEQR